MRREGLITIDFVDIGATDRTAYATFAVALDVQAEERETPDADEYAWKNFKPGKSRWTATASWNEVILEDLTRDLAQQALQELAFERARFAITFTSLAGTVYTSTCWIAHQEFSSGDQSILRANVVFRGVAELVATLPDPVLPESACAVFRIIPDDITGLSDGAEIVDTFVEGAGASTVGPSGSPGPTYYSSRFVMDGSNSLSISTPPALNEPVVIVTSFVISEINGFPWKSGSDGNTDPQIWSDPFPTEFDIHHRGTFQKMYEDIAFDVWHSLIMISDPDASETDIIVDGNYGTANANQSTPFGSFTLASQMTGSTRGAVAFGGCTISEQVAEAQNWIDYWNSLSG